MAIVARVSEAHPGSFTHEIAADTRIANAYRVAVNPPHVEPADRYNGLARDLEHGPQAFLRALAREADLQRQPDVLRKVQAALEPYNPYDWR